MKNYNDLIELARHWKHALIKNPDDYQGVFLLVNYIYLSEDGFSPYIHYLFEDITDSLAFGRVSPALVEIEQLINALEEEKLTIH